tara:strand:- start:3860 stop:4270 length:411 start_codon:yes stop_codon:yes gene_type:complete
MALTGTKQESIHGKTGDDLAVIKASFDNGEHTNLIEFGPEAAIIYQIQKMQDEITYLRTEISNNKDKTGISSGQASAITANTAKVGFVTTMPTATDGHTVSLSVTNTRGAYALVFTMVDQTNKKSPVTKTARIELS